jgi:putative membrane protein
MMGGWGWFGGGWLVMIVFWAVAIGLIVLLVRGVRSEDMVISSKSKDKVNHKGETNPLEILKARYAKGEIDKKQYEEMKKELKK